MNVVLLLQKKNLVRGVRKFMKPLKYQEVVRFKWRGYQTHLWDRPRRYGGTQYKVSLI